jgi:hypothetical protein
MFGVESIIIFRVFKKKVWSYGLILNWKALQGKCHHFGP